MKIFKTTVFFLLAFTFAFSQAEASGIKVVPKKTQLTTSKRTPSSTHDICGELVMGIGTNWGIKKGGVTYMVRSNNGWPTTDNDGNKCGYESPMCMCDVSVNRSTDDDTVRTVNGEVSDSQIKCGSSHDCGWF